MTDGAAPINVRKERPAAAPAALQLFRLFYQFMGHLAPGLTGRIAYSMWITPPRFPTPKTERDAIASARTDYLEFDGHRIATYSWGDSGPAVLLVHGWSGRGSQLFPFIQPLLERGLRVVAFDGPAHGNSAGKQTNIYEIVDTILQLDRHYGRFAGAITHSFGGPCLAAAMKRGMHTGCVVNISPPSTTIGLVDKFCRTLQVPRRARDALVEYIERRFGSEVWESTAMENNLAGIDVPAMVIHDVDDVDVPWHEGQAIARAWKHVRFIRTSGLGHRRILKDPETIRSAVDFVSQELATSNAA